MRQPLDIVLDLFYGRWRSQTLHAGVTLGVFEAIGREPAAAASLARELDLDTALAYRLLRALASLGVLQEHGGHAFSLTDAGAILRADHPQSMRDALLLREGPEHTAIWKHLPTIVRDGRQGGFVREYGVDAFAHATRDASYGRAFDAGMSSQSNPAKLGVGERCAAVAGDMFVDVPAADAYLLKMILHDWNDAECLQILSNLRRRAPADGRVFIVEHVIPDDGRPDFAALFDMHMMCWGTGRERTVREYGELLDASGWTMAATWFPPSGAIGVVEGRLAA